ncbi:MAG: carboxymuconolactone decarboxylase family protein [Pseudomonadota bacterium]
MSRLSLLSIQDAKKAAAQVDIPAPKAVASIYRALLQHPILAKRVNDLIETLLVESALNPQLRELIIMRIGWSNEGVYEWTQHWRIAQQFGVTERDLLAVRDWQGHEHWSVEQQTVLQATDEMLVKGAISSEAWEACTQVLPSDRERLELVTTIGTWKMVSDLLKCLEVPLDEGLTPWPPDGVSPGSWPGSTG